MTTGRLGQDTAPPPNAAYAGQVVHFPDPVRASRHPRGVRVDERGYPDFSPYARAAAEIADPPEGFGVDELRLTDYVSANAALAATGHELWDTIPAVATPHGWTWHHVAHSRRLELVPVEVKALLRHHGGVATASGVDQYKRGTRPLQATLSGSYDSATEGYNNFASLYGNAAGQEYRLAWSDSDHGERDTPAGTIDNTAFGGPLVSTSANLAGEPPAYTAATLDPRLLARVDGVCTGETGGLAAPTAIRDAYSGAVLRA